MSAPLTIWIVDDDAIARLLIRKILERADGFEEIREMKNVRVLLEAIEQDNRSGRPLPDLVLLDLNMPGMGGWEFLDICLERDLHFPHTKIVILTSSINPVDEEKAAGYPMVTGFVQKPLTVESLTEILDT